VSINGKVIGRTLVAVDLQLGSHRILVEKKGHTSNNYMLQLERAGASSLYYDLQADDRAR
jgi:hypothetical protein